jgi:deazaflavin-dependent oxidoreductase (nitroreductase family)
MSDWNTKVIEELRANGGHAPSMGGATLLILHTIGAKSGKERLSPLLYRERGDALVIFASYAGAPVNPAWFHNLLAHPDVTVEVGGETRAVRARVAEGAERDELYDWNKQDYETFVEYEAKTDRVIPVVILEPVRDGGSRR